MLGLTDVTPCATPPAEHMEQNLHLHIHSPLTLFTKAPLLLPKVSGVWSQMLLIRSSTCLICCLASICNPEEE